MNRLLLLFFVILLNACHAIKPANKVMKLSGFRWQLTAINHKVLSDTSAYLIFSEKLEVKGRAFCNHIKTDYTLMGKDQLTFDKIVSTKMFCDGKMDLENEMLSNMEQVKRYEIKNGMLYLYNPDQLLLTFVMKEKLIEN